MSILLTPHSCFADAQETFESYAPGSTFTSGQTLGAGGSGWTQGWRTSASLATPRGAVVAAPVVDAAQNLACSVVTQAGKTASSASVCRAFDATALTGPFTISFSFRPDAAPGNVTYLLSDNQLRSAFGPDATSAWQIAAINGAWQVYDGSVGGGTNAYINTGMAVTAGVVYDMEIAVDPVAHTWQVTLSNGSTTVTKTALHARGATFATDNSDAIGARWLTLAVKENTTGTTVGATGAFSVDSIEIATGTTPPPAAQVQETFESYASGATFSTSQTLGAAGSGWTQGWRTSGSFSTPRGTVATTPVVDVGKLLACSVVTQSGKTVASGSLCRAYDATGLASPFSVNFSLRPDTAPANVSYIIADNQNRSAAGGDGTAAWQIASVNGTWQLFDGTAGGPGAYVNTGLAATAGVVVDFVVTVDPTAHTWSATLSNGAASFTKTGLHARSNSFATDATDAIGGRWLTFAVKETTSGTTVGATGSFSIDSIGIAFGATTPPTTDPPTGPTPPTAPSGVIRTTPLLLSTGGTAANPAVYDGQGITIDLGLDVTNRSWTKTGDIWTSNGPLIGATPIAPGQYTALFVDEVPITLANQSGGGYKPASQLLPGKMGVLADGSFYFRWPTGKTPGTGKLFAMPQAAASCVTIQCSYITVKNITAIHAPNDGFNIHGSFVGIRLENIRAISNADEGISAHNTVQMDVQTAEIAWNGSFDAGIADVDQSRTTYNGVIVHDNIGIAGMKFFGVSGRVTNSLIYNQNQPFYIGPTTTFTESGNTTD